jgi:type IV secretion system protein VirB11
MLRTALGPSIAGWLEDPGVVEVMLNPDGRLWVDRLTDGLVETGEHLSAADGERIVRSSFRFTPCQCRASRNRRAL